MESQDDIQLPTFAQKYSGNVQDGGLKPARSPFRLPRTVYKEEDPDAIYALPKKLPKSTDKRDSLTSLNYVQGFSGSLFKRYEAGSILSTVSSEYPPVVYHDRETLVRELGGHPEQSYADNVVFSKEEDLYSKPRKRLGVKKQGNAGGRCNCCSGKVIVAVVVAAITAAAVVAIAVGGRQLKIQFILFSSVKHLFNYRL